MRLSDWSSDVCSSDRLCGVEHREGAHVLRHARLEVAVFALERRHAAAQAVVGGARLQADLVGPHVLGVVLGVLRVVDRIGAAVEAARLEAAVRGHVTHRSEEHTSELQSLMRISYAVFCLKKKKKSTQNYA